jgi:hypothetical protein
MGSGGDWRIADAAAESESIRVNQTESGETEDRETEPGNEKRAAADSGVDAGIARNG